MRAPALLSFALLLLALPLARAAEPATPVILISIDTLRADHLSAYGYRALHTPNIDAFAQNGTLAANAQTQIPLTLPSHTTLLTSTYPFENHTEENAEPVAPGAVTLASILRAHGFQTGAFIGSVFLERQLGLDQGFDLYDSPFDFAAFSPLSGEMLAGARRGNAYEQRETRPGPLVLRAALQWLNERRNRPVFAFVHLFDLHLPYRVSGDAARAHGLSRYDAELESIDGMLGRFRQSLLANGLWDRALVILVSDHGESLGEHGENTHGYFAYQSTLWVPLLIHWPAASPKAAGRVDAPVGLIDVAPTILDFLHIPAPPTFEGHSLLKPEAHVIYGESVYAHDAFGWAPLRTLRQGDWKLIEAPKPELYNLHDDPGERHNQIHNNPTQATSLRAQLMQLLNRYAPGKPAAAHGSSPAQQALLHSLGYIASGPAVRLTTTAPDPKDRLPEYQLYEDALDAGYRGQTETAIARLNRLLATDPHNTLATRDLAECYIETGAYAKARLCFERVLTVSPRDYMSHFGLALADEHLSHRTEALEHLKTACGIAPEAEQCHTELQKLQSK